MQIKIGYQGMRGSNALAAAKQMCEALGINSVSYIPLVTSAGVTEALLKGKVQYGVMATCNVIAGEVEETKVALQDLKYECMATCRLPIHHCLFIKRDKLLKQDIRQVASHIQALKQCENYLTQHFGKIDLLPIEDTAIGAKYLAEGRLDEKTAILCRKEAGLQYKLLLLAENIEDFKENYTEFMMIRHLRH